MKRTDKKGLKWLFPSEAEIYTTKIEQIVVRNIPVRYSLTAVMRFALDEETHTYIENCFKIYCCSNCIWITQ